MDMDDMDMDMDMVMQMSFSNSINVTILFDWWTTENIGEYIGSLAVIALLVISFQFTRNFQQLFVYHWAYILKEKERLLRQRNTTNDRHENDGYRSLEDNNRAPEANRMLNRKMPFKVRCMYAGLASFNYAFSLLLMLMAMTFNVGVFVALITGYFLGDILFASTPLSIADLTEVDHCA
eukprot:CAMPEP_0117767392 /NCGR_PEP_ID=MMETSP0947-20121206/21585_1 /TAXON_ID=44440 /ORGANISM="Chattonella subsalsa, Strain CCMP2191" /LENGTH=178 /DNA_ID=CAMNT_0005591039 /DNA_START=84 /DNA_END=620 /DNA_ORIENTATION=+